MENIKQILHFPSGNRFHFLNTFTFIIITQLSSKFS